MFPPAVAENQPSAPESAERKPRMTNKTFSEYNERLREFIRSSFPQSPASARSAAEMEQAFMAAIDQYGRRGEDLEQLALGEIPQAGGWRNGARSGR